MPTGLYQFATLFFNVLKIYEFAPPSPLLNNVKKSAKLLGDGICNYDQIRKYDFFATSFFFGNVRHLFSQNPLTFLFYTFDAGLPFFDDE